MQFDDERERPLTARLKEPRQQRLVPVAEIFNVFCLDIIRLGCGGCHDMLLLFKNSNGREYGDLGTGTPFQQWPTAI
jgi:hypothetical protein